MEHGSQFCFWRPSKEFFLFCCFPLSLLSPTLFLNIHFFSAHLPQHKANIINCNQEEKRFIFHMRVFSNGGYSSQFRINFDFRTFFAWLTKKIKNLIKNWKTNNETKWMAQEEQIDVHMIRFAFCSHQMKNENQKGAKNWSLTTFERFVAFSELVWTLNILNYVDFSHFSIMKQINRHVFELCYYELHSRPREFLFSSLHFSWRITAFSFISSRWLDEIWNWIVSFDMKTLVEFLAHDRCEFLTFW